MATDILNIPQIPNQDISLLQNDLHIGFTGDIAKRLQKLRWADEAHTLKVFPEAVDALMGAFVVAQGKEDQAYVIVQGVAVAPTDTIDVSREYELIALG